MKMSHLPVIIFFEKKNSASIRVLATPSGDALAAPREFQMRANVSSHILKTLETTHVGFFRVTGCEMLRA
jgi:hypothetical protein